MFASLFSVLLYASLSLFNAFKVIETVSVTEVRILSASGRTDYVLSGESVTLSCIYLLQEDEEVKNVVWEKDDDSTVYVYEMYNNKATPYTPFNTHVDPENCTPTTIALKNVSKELYGKYVCRVVTDRGQSQSEAVLVVIVDACKEKAWQFHINMIDCEEGVTFFCRGMFPKPSPACGLYNDLTGTYIRSIMFDRIELRPDGTYEISLYRRFSVEDYLEFPGQVSFHCYLLVVSTTWRRGVHHKMFGEAGCTGKIVNPKNGYYNLTSERTCWNTPREGSRLLYGCNDNYELEGSGEYICSNGNWKAVINETSNATSIPASRSDALQGPVVCNFSFKCIASNRCLNGCFLFFILVFKITKIL